MNRRLLSHELTELWTWTDTVLAVRYKRTYASVEFTRPSVFEVG